MSLLEGKSNTFDKTIQYINAKNMILEYLQSNDKITSAKIQEI